MEYDIRRLEKRLSALEGSVVDMIDAQKALVNIVFGRRTHYVIAAIFGASVVFWIWGIIQIVRAWMG